MTTTTGASGIRPWFSGPTVLRVGYAFALAAAGVLAPFLVGIGMGRRLEGEMFESLMLGWWFGVPGALLASVVSSILVFPFYRSCRSAFSTAALFLLNGPFAGLLG